MNVWYAMDECGKPVRYLYSPQIYIYFFHLGVVVLGQPTYSCLASNSGSVFLILTNISLSPLHLLLSSSKFCLLRINRFSFRFNFACRVQYYYDKAQLQPVAQRGNNDVKDHHNEQLAPKRLSLLAACFPDPTLIM